ncbi:MAG: hypothetical protein IJQ79_06245, partial [Bacteroidales bacterium]|nr:hypothetical protein [Bacteroidales bacterium]
VQGDDSLASRQACRGMVVDRLRRPQADRGDSSAAAEGEPSPSPLGVQGDYSNTLEAYKVLAL